jgi:hypothetical protein
VCGIVAADRVELHVPPERQRLWSPELRVDVETEGEGCRLRGTYGPHPHVWMLFAAIYGLLGCAALVAGVFAMAEWTLGRGVSSLYAFPVLVLLVLAVRSLAFFGQGLGGEQMDELRGFLEEVLEQGADPKSVPRRSGIVATGEYNSRPASGMFSRR